MKLGSGIGSGIGSGASAAIGRRAGAERLAGDEYGAIAGAGQQRSHCGLVAAPSADELEETISKLP